LHTARRSNSWQGWGEEEKHAQRKILAVHDDSDGLQCKGAKKCPAYRVRLSTKTILQMHVNKSEYILRKPLQITNLDFLFSQTNAPVTTNVLAIQ